MPANEGLLFAGALVIGLLLCVAQVVALQVASNTMRPEPRLGLGQALAVWFGGALLGGIVQCALGAALQGAPEIAGLVSLAASFATFGVVLSVVAGMDLLSAFGAVLVWWLLMGLVGVVVGGSLVGAFWLVA